MTSPPQQLSKILAKPIPHLQEQTQPITTVTPSKRKRSFVSLACAACRKRKTKCDAQRPTCQPCKQRHVECVYDFPDDLPAAQRGKRAVELLTQANTTLRNTLEDLRSATEEYALALFKNLRQAKTLDQFLKASTENSIISSASDKVSQTSDEGHTILQGLPASPELGFVLGRERQHNSENTNNSNSDDAPEILPISQWTNVSGSDTHLTELLLLMWTWDTSFTRVIDRGTFEQDLKHGAYETPCDSPSRQFCSTFLVNAMLGFACVYTTDERTFARPGDPTSRGRKFIEYAEAQIDKKRQDPSYDFLMGLVMMYGYECRIGSGARARELLDMVFETYKVLDWDEFEVRREIDQSDLQKSRVFQAKVKAAWGLYILDWTFSHTYGTRKRLEKPKMRKAWQEFDSNIGQPTTPEYYWCNWAKSSPRQRSFYKEVFDAECDLIEIAQESLVFLYPNETGQPETSIQVSQAWELYDRLQNWRISFSDAIPDDARELPQSLYVICCHEMLVIIVLRKVAHLTREDTGGGMSPRSICYLHATGLMSTVCTYRALYTARYEFWAIQACSVVAFTILFDLDTDPILHDSFEKACRTLWEISQIYPIASDFLLAIRVVVYKQGVKVSKSATKYLSMVDSFQQGDLSKEWRAPVVLAATDGTRGGILDVSLGDLTEDLNRFKLG